MIHLNIACTVYARYDPVAGEWGARIGAQTHNDQFDGWGPPHRGGRSGPEALLVVMRQSPRRLAATMNGVE